MEKILDGATSDGAGTARTVTGGTTLILFGTIGPTAVVNVKIAPTTTTDYVPFVSMNSQNRTAVVPLGRSDAEALINADLSGVVSGDGTNVKLYVL
jgi:hypothetical protein